MVASKCVLTGKSGVKELDHSGAYAVIANRRLYERGEAHKFAVVNTQKAWVDSVYRNHRQARSAMQHLA